MRETGATMTMKRATEWSAGLAGVVLLAGLAAGSAALASTPYDGKWSVSVITDSGDCDRAYRYEINIVDGRLTYDDPAFAVSGRVDAGGQVNVTIKHGQDGASGSGRLSGAAGSGHWSGQSTTNKCSGHWEAERRE
jgi:hypothetical protein